MDSKLILPKLAFALVDDAEEYYRNNKCFTDDILEGLQSVFGNAFFHACEFLESYNFKLVEYQTEDGSRTIYKLSNHKEQFTIYKDINFCYCETFRNGVLELREHITCKHVLAVKLGRIMNKVTREIIKDVQLVEFLNEQLNYLKEA